MIFFSCPSKSYEWLSPFSYGLVIIKKRKKRWMDHLRIVLLLLFRTVFVILTRVGMQITFLYFPL